MRLLILGGTWFLGRALGELALEAGWSVTTFNRGVSAADLPGVEAIRGDREQFDDLSRLAEHGPWDAVVDTIGFVPREVLAAATALAPAVRNYVFLSSVNVYTGWPSEPLNDTSPVFECPPDADVDFGAELGYAGQYGALKAGCERAVIETLGTDRAAILRPGVILGPNEYVGRLTWWLARAARGGELLAPGPLDRPIQPIDVRDVASFALRCASDGVVGSFNLGAPIGRATFADLIDACVAATGADSRPVWVDPEWLVERGVQQWTELPLWRTHEGVWKVDSSRAEHAGLRCRPLTQTVADTWAWMTDGGTAITGSGEAARAADHGLAADRERELLQEWNRRV
ncbi:NAD-dependent epimerase/dehydratase family protein [Dactylosporangium sp. NPDC048998]|uniref:NAD-dependent epimerase/dehydratase family protein n=1 Tax=Dactylosporangium sp. NPDC048998 TaxID=3363976 RepID=UPI0037242DBA